VVGSPLPTASIASITDAEPADHLFCGDEQAVYGDQA
jgi:hypothetical protein